MASAGAIEKAVSVVVLLCALYIEQAARNFAGIVQTQVRTYYVCYSDSRSSISRGGGASHLYKKGGDAHREISIEPLKEPIRNIETNN